MRLWTVEETQWFHGLAAPSSCSFPHFNEHSLSTFFFHFLFDSVFFSWLLNCSRGEYSCTKLSRRKLAYESEESFYRFIRSTIIESKKIDKKTTRARQKGGKLYWELFSILYVWEDLTFVESRKKGRKNIRKFLSSSRDAAISIKFYHLSFDYVYERTQVYIDSFSVFTQHRITSTWDTYMY